MRNSPHVEGQFAAYVYVPVVISKKSRMFSILSRIYFAAKESVPTLHPIGLTEADMAKSNGEGPSSASDDGQVELHVSLTRPTYLRAHQREEFKRAVRTAARTNAKCVLVS